MDESGYPCEHMGMSDEGYTSCWSSSEIVRLREENAKLRELATEVIRLMQADGPDCGLCKHYSECWTSDAMNYSPSGCVICNEARDLGIEV
jgi:hypothetical protein